MNPNFPMDRWLEKAVWLKERLKSALSVCSHLTLTGLVVAIPLLATGWVFKKAYELINDISEPFLKHLLGIRMPVVPFVVTLLLFILIGFMASNVFGRRLLERMEAAFLRIPVVATVYSAIKQVIDSFKTFRNKANFKRVVYLDCPVTGGRLIGLVTGQFFDAKLGEEMTTVIIPTSPSPVTCILVVVPERQLMESSLSLEEAMKMIVSAGLVVPGVKAGEIKGA